MRSWCPAGPSDESQTEVQTLSSAENGKICLKIFIAIYFSSPLNLEFQSNPETLFSSEDGCILALSPPRILPSGLPGDKRQQSPSPQCSPRTASCPSRTTAASGVTSPLDAPMSQTRARNPTREIHRMGPMSTRFTARTPDHPPPQRSQIANTGISVRAPKPPKAPYKAPKAPSKAPKPPKAPSKAPSKASKAPKAF